jgi:hypothetical protein
VPTAELFERFKKGNSGSDSIGIGLAIVRQICDLSHFTIDYQYRDGFHCLAVGFSPRVAASKLLQNLSLPLHSRARSPVPHCSHSRKPDNRISADRKNSSFIMSKQIRNGLFWALLLSIPTARCHCAGADAQTGCTNALNNYGTIRAKANYVKASQANVREARRNIFRISIWLPSRYMVRPMPIMVRWPLQGCAGSFFRTGTCDPELECRFWALYWTNVNWDFFQFGRYKEKTAVAQP